MFFLQDPKHVLNDSIDIGKSCFSFLFGRRFEISLNICGKTKICLFHLNPKNAHHIIDIGESCFSFLFFCQLESFFGKKI